MNGSTQPLVNAPIRTEEPVRNASPKNATLTSINRQFPITDLPLPETIRSTTTTVAPRLIRMAFTSPAPVASATVIAVSHSARTKTATPAPAQRQLRWNNLAFEALLKVAVQSIAARR